MSSIAQHIPAVEAHQLMLYGPGMSHDEIRNTTRARRSEGPRTTLRLPHTLVAVADRLAAELSISRNDAVLRLATRGAAIYEQERVVAERRAARWAAVVPGAVAPDARFPTLEEARAAVLAARAGDEAAT
jgi:hypothetical protein